MCSKVTIPSDCAHEENYRSMRGFYLESRNDVVSFEVFGAQLCRMPLRNPKSVQLFVYYFPGFVACSTSAMLDLLYNGMGIRARVCVSPLSSYLYIISMTTMDG